MRDRERGGATGRLRRSSESRFYGSSVCRFCVRIAKDAAPTIPPSTLFTSLPLPVRRHSSQASTLPLATTCSLQQMAFAIFQLNFHSPECLPALYLPHIACARMHVFIFISFSFSSSFSFSLPFNPFEADSFVWQVRARRGCQPS